MTASALCLLWEREIAPHRVSGPNCEQENGGSSKIFVILLSARTKLAPHAHCPWSLPLPAGEQSLQTLEASARVVKLDGGKRPLAMQLAAQRDKVRELEKKSAALREKVCTFALATFQSTNFSGDRTL